MQVCESLRGGKNRAVRHLVGALPTEQSAASGLNSTMSVGVASAFESAVNTAVLTRDADVAPLRRQTIRPRPGLRRW